LGGEFWPFCEEYFGKKIFCHKFPVFLTPQKKKRSQKGPSIAYNMKGCLRFSTVMFQKLPNFGQIQVKQHHKIGKKGKKKKTLSCCSRT